VVTSQKLTNNFAGMVTSGLESNVARGPPVGPHWLRLYSVKCNYESYAGIWKMNVAAYLKVLYWHSPGEPEADYEQSVKIARSIPTVSFCEGKCICITKANKRSKIANSAFLKRAYPKKFYACTSCLM
jgi:hypothetical protein